MNEKAIKYLSTIETMIDELTTGNLSHKKAFLKGYVSRAKEYLTKHQ